MTILTNNSTAVGKSQMVVTEELLDASVLLVCFEINLYSMIPLADISVHIVSRTVC